MRITNNMLTDNMLFNLNQNLKIMSKIDRQVSTGKKFQVPSDDPIGVSKSLKYYTDLSKIEQYKRNAKDAYSWMKETESALVEVGNVLHRANELAVQTANDTYSKDDLQKVSEEIKQLRNHLIQVSNSTYAGRHIFSGFNTNEKLLNDDGTYNVDIFMEDEDNEEIFEYNIGVSERVKVNTLGQTVFGKGDKDFSSDVTKGDKSHIIDVFDRFNEALENKDSDALQNAIEETKGCMDQILSVRANVGAKMNRLELTQKRLESQTISTVQLISDNEDVEADEAITKLKSAESVYRASLSIGTRIIQPSLVDFLR